MSDNSIPGTSPADRGQPEGVADLLKQLRDDALALIRQETALLKTETGENIAKLSRNAAYVAAGGLVALVGVIFILHAVTGLLTILLVEAGLEEHALWVAPLIVGAIVAAIGAVLTQKGIATLKTTSLTPDKTIDSLKKDTEWLQHKTA